MMKARAIAAADALGSIRVEGLEPSSMVCTLIQRWTQDEISDEELDAAKRRIIEVNTSHMQT